MRLFANANYPFLEQRKRAYVISAAALAIGLLSIAAHRGLDYGVDFTGGTLLQIRFDQTASSAELRSAFGDVGFTKVQVQGFGGENEFLVRMAEFTEGGDRELATRVDDLLAARFGEGSYQIVRTEGVGPRVGAELRQRAVYAVLISFLLTLLYLGFRFEWRFGLAAIVATVHDVLIAFGLISLFSIEISLATVAAILTIIGYSLNDTIVVFDRVRENLKKHRRQPYIVTLDESINETLPRTVVTSGTTLAVLLALATFGGAVIREFTIVLIIGVVIGTYSSIFVASPVLLEVETRSGGARRGGSAERRKPAAASR